MKTKPDSLRALRAAISFALALGGAALTSAKPPEVPPDLTLDRSVDRAGTYNLGPTGLRGWIFTRAANFADSQQGQTTTQSRQILVTHVGEGSPAAGVMAVDDVILGVGGERFTSDARQAFGAAITAAERDENRGELKLTRWRDGKIEDVVLPLRVMGNYGASPPFDCPKSQRIFAGACAALEKEPLNPSWNGAVNGLALLATGNPDYLPRVKELAMKIVPQALAVELRPGMVVWDWGYKNLFLCEYYQVTRDAAVLPAIAAYTTTLARGQSLYGTFGHGISEPTAGGGLHGSIPPYGPVNAAGLIGNLAIAAGQRCGVADAEVEAAVGRAAKFFGYFVDKGAIPYGEHMPWPNHDNNGKNAMAAVMFAMMGTRPQETQYFAKMVTASFHNREYGHTGQGFSYLWGALGANAGGPAAAGAFLHEAAWHLDLVRRSDGSFTYDGGEQFGPGKTDDDSYFGNSGYYGLSPNACYVLSYSLPLKKLWITGKDANTQNFLSANDVAEAVASGHFYAQRRTRSVPELVAALGDWSPVVRGFAAAELASRPEAKAMVPELIALAEGEDKWQRQGACEALGHLRDPAALPVLARALTHPDRWLRVKAANALKNMGDRAKPVVTEMLKAIVSTAEPTFPVQWDDPVQLTHGELAEALFGGLLRGSIEGIDTSLLYPAIQAVARNPDGMARMRLNHLFTNQLQLEDIEALAPDILEAVRTRCPADTMFGNEIRMAGFRALTKFHFEEGIEAGVLFAMTQGGHGSESRTGEIMEGIVSYGTAARSAIPGLRELIAELNAQCERREFPRGELNDRRVGAVEEAISAIEAATTQPELRRIPAQAPGSKPAAN